MSEDIVTRLREKYSGQLPICSEAADEIERLRSQNTELVKMFKQVGVVAEMWQKSEDELIDFHQGKSIEALMKQADEIERLREEVSRLTLLANLWEAEFNAAVNAITGKAVTSDGTGKP